MVMDTAFPGSLQNLKFPFLSIFVLELRNSIILSGLNSNFPFNYRNSCCLPYTYNTDHPEQSAPLGT